jgi:hypothetical protein
VEATGKYIRSLFLGDGPKLIESIANFGRDNDPLFLAGARAGGVHISGYTESSSVLGTTWSITYV